MNLLADFFLSFAERSAVEAVGWLLLHSLWQFTTVGLIVVILLRFLRTYSAMLRYQVLLSALGLMFIAPIASWYWLASGHRDDPLPKAGDSGEARADAVDDTADKGMPADSAQGASLDSNSDDDHSVGTSLNGRGADGRGADGRDHAPERAVGTPTTDSAPLGDDDPRLARIGSTVGVDNVPSPTVAASGAASRATWINGAVALLTPWLPVIVIVWVVGMFLASVRPLIGWHVLRRLRRFGVSPVPEKIQQLFEATIGRLGVRRAVQVLESARVNTPVVAGYFKPIVLLPTSIVSEMPMQQLEAILAHELAHVRRVDYVVNLLQTLVETVYFYHPAIWWVSKRIRVEREHCCDDIVVTAFDNRVDYGRALLAITQMRSTNSPLAVGAGGSPLLSRIRRLWGIEPTDRSRGSACVCCMVLATGILFAVSAWQVVADDKKPKPSPTPASTKKEPAPIQLTVLDHQGERVVKPVILHVPYIGYSRGAKTHKVLTTNDTGEIELKGLAPGKHSFIVEPANGMVASILTIDAPAEKNSIEVRMTAPYETGRTMLEAKINVSGFEARDALYCELLNEQGKPFTLRDSDFCLTSQNWRVFLPKKLSLGGKVIDHSKRLYVNLDWTVIVTEGLWLSRDLEEIDEPWPANAPAAGNEHFRAFLGNSGTAAFELPTPDTILNRLAAQLKATTSLTLSKKTYFVGEHIPIHYNVHNNGNVPIIVSWGGDSRAPRPLRFKIVAKGAEGRVDDPFPTPWCMGGLGSAQTVEPGGKYDMGELALQSYCRFSKPGKYRLQAYHDLGWIPGNRYDSNSPIALEKNEIPKEAKYGPVATGEIEIKEPSVEEAREVVRQLRKTHDRDYYTPHVFSALQTNAYLPALREWIEENGGILGGDEQRRKSGITLLPATSGIGGIHTPEATKMLLDLLNHKNPEVVIDVRHQLGRRLPYPYLKRRRTETRALELQYRLSQQAWRDEFRKPVLDYALQILRANLDDERDAPDLLEKDRLAKAWAAGVLRAVARQDDYPLVRDATRPVVEEYRDLAAEQGSYPRPVTVTQSIIDALWFAFSNGRLEFDPAASQTEFSFKTNDLEKLFEANEIDVFTTARLLSQVDDFLPAGRIDWYKKQLRSDVPWVRAYVMSQMKEPVDFALRTFVARNIESAFPAVQAEALGLARRAPAASYIPKLQRAAKGGDKWIKPLAEAALEACLKSSEKKQAELVSKEEQVPNEEQVTPIAVTKRWKDLLAQPVIKLESGSARLGVQSREGSVGSGVLLFCLTTDYARPTKWEGTNHIGPFTVEIRHERQGREFALDREMMSKTVAEGVSRATALYRYQVKIEKPGKYRVAVKSADGNTVGTAEIVVKEGDYHPWLPFGAVPLGLFELDEQFDAVGAVRNSETGTALPAVDGMTRLVYQKKGAEPQFPDSALLPVLQPVADGSLSIKSIDDKLVVVSEHEIVLSWPEHYFLARWWVNDKPFIPSNEANLLAMQLSGQVVTGKSLLLALECDPRRFDATFADKIEVQLMHCANGWEYSQSQMAHMQMAELESPGPDVVVSNRIQVFPQVFTRFEATFENRFGNQVPTRVMIDGRGNVVYHSDEDERLNVQAYDAKFKLSPELLLEFVTALDKSKWLTTEIDKDGPPRSHPTSYKLQLLRNRQVKSVDFEDGQQDALRPYRALIHLLNRLHRQEDTLRNLQSAQDPSRETALRSLNNELQSIHGHRNVQPPYLTILDWRRFLPRMRDILQERERVNRSELIAALRTMSHLEDEAAWEDVAWHFRNPRLYSKNLSTPVRDALVDAIVAYGGQRSVDLLAEDEPYFYVSAWGLIRCGDVAVPKIVEIIEVGPGPSGRDNRFETMFRTYLTHWKELPTPVDKRVVDAVRKSMDDPAVQKFRTQHHREFLDKVAASERQVWGNAVNGVSVHLRSLKDTWPANYAVKMSCDVRNEGIRNASVKRSAWTHKLEVDGTFYVVDVDGPTVSVAPGRAIANLDFELTKKWVGQEDGKPLELALGEHTIRLHIVVHSPGKITLVSNPVKINVSK